MGGARFTYGDKGVSRITVYRRAHSPAVYVEWWDDDGRHRKVLKDRHGNRITDWDDAQEIAKVMSEAQRKRRNRLGAEYFGVADPEDRTLEDLFERRHADLGPGWSAKYAKSRELRRAFWLERLGKATPLTRITAAVAERAAKDAQVEAARSDRWRQDVLRYLVDSFYYAERKLKWIEAAHNLSAVTMPKPRGRLPSYTLEEAVALVRALEGVHPVGHWLAVVAFQTGRRINAILSLTKADVEPGGPGEPTALHFHASDDKAGKEGVAFVYGLPRRTDWRSYSYDDAKVWLLEAEKAAEVPHKKKRAWHAFKKVYATATTGMEGADHQSGTRRETLEERYREDVTAPKAEVAKALAARLG